MNTLMVALMTWIHVHTGLPVPDELPTVQFADRCEIERFYHGDGQRDCTGEGLRIQAIYVRERALIMLSDKWDATDLYQVSALLHELVHHMQAQNGAEMGADSPCPGENIEKPAYDAQIAWLEAAGADAFEVMSINALSLYMLTSCDF